jgi:hypothetical protein
MDLNIPEQLATLHAYLSRARTEHFRLVWVVGGAAMERSALLRAFSESEGCPLLEVGQSLSQALLDVPASLRAASVEECFSDLLDSADGSPVCLDRLEILFEPSLKLYPAELVKNTSRHRTLVASWPGTRDDDSLTFGPEGHPAHRSIPCERMECQIFEIHS